MKLRSKLLRSCLYVFLLTQIFSINSLAADPKQDISQDLKDLEEKVNSELNKRNTNIPPLAKAIAQNPQTSEPPVDIDKMLELPSLPPAKVEQKGGEMDIKSKVDEEISKINVNPATNIQKSAESKQQTIAPSLTEQIPGKQPESPDLFTKAKSLFSSPAVQANSNQAQVNTTVQPEKIKKAEVMKDQDILFSPDIKTRKVYDYRNQSLSRQINKDKYGPNNQHLPRTFYEKEYSQYLFVAVINDDISSVKSLLERGADINAKDAKNGYTPLMYSALYNKLKAMQFLISRGANLNSASDDGKTALHVAAIRGNLKVMDILLSSGADTSIKDKENKSFFIYAAKLGDDFAILAAKNSHNKDEMLIELVKSSSIPAVRYLLKNGANIDYPDALGNTALIYATMQNNIKLVNLLLFEGASPHIKNQQGKCALDYAVASNNFEIGRVIKTVMIKKELEGNYLANTLEVKQPKTIDKQTYLMDTKNLAAKPSKGKKSSKSLEAEVITAQPYSTYTKEQQTTIFSRSDAAKKQAARVEVIKETQIKGVEDNVGDSQNEGGFLTRLANKFSNKAKPEALPEASQKIEHITKNEQISKSISVSKSASVEPNTLSPKPSTPQEDGASGPVSLLPY